jgi:hypothetical protein
VVQAVRARHPSATVLVPSGMPPGDRPPGGQVVPATGAALEVGDLDVRVTPAPDRLVVEAWPGRR